MNDKYESSSSPEVDDNPLIPQPMPDNLRAEYEKQAMAVLKDFRRNDGLSELLWGMIMALAAVWYASKLADWNLLVIISLILSMFWVIMVIVMYVYQFRLIRNTHREIPKHILIETAQYSVDELVFIPLLFTLYLIKERMAILGISIMREYRIEVFMVVGIGFISSITLYFYYKYKSRRMLVWSALSLLIIVLSNMRAVSSYVFCLLIVPLAVLMLVFGILTHVKFLKRLQLPSK